MEERSLLSLSAYSPSCQKVHLFAVISTSFLGILVCTEDHLRYPALWTEPLLDFVDRLFIGSHCFISWTTASK